jgi:hypothetical protein
MRSLVLFVIPVFHLDLFLTLSNAGFVHPDSLSTNIVKQISAGPDPDGLTLSLSSADDAAALCAGAHPDAVATGEANTTTEIAIRLLPIREGLWLASVAGRVPAVVLLPQGEVDARMVGLRAGEKGVGSGV